ncbi:glyoxalase [Kitasatospora sp. HPMI-4]|uniref:glyoxalase n=1 Tax=Kitasatospora sp. HPMI-4 TaxID=3448443 RepID=UPI003F19862F
MRYRVIAFLVPATVAATVLPTPASSSAHVPLSGCGPRPAASRLAVGPQYDTTHVYVEHGKVPAFSASWKATFGGSSTAVSTTTVTPTPSRTESELVFSPVGTLSVFDFQTPLPYPFGTERTGWLMKDFDKGVQRAKDSGASLLVAPFPDPIGRDAVIQFPGGVNTQIYWHTTPPSYPPLTTVPENRVYLPNDTLDAFLCAYLKFTGGTVTSDDAHADAAGIGMPGGTYRRIRTSSEFGDTLITVTDGHLPYPFGREVTGYRVARLGENLDRAKAAGAKVLWGPHSSTDRDSAIVEFPGGYIAEIHDTAGRGAAHGAAGKNLPSPNGDSGRTRQPHK